MDAAETGCQSREPNQHELIELVYEAVLEPSLWPQLLEQMGHYLNTIPAPGDDEVIVLGGNAHDALASHFKRAVKIQQKVSRLESLTQAFISILNRLPIGVILVRRNASAVAQNQLASDVLDEAGHLFFQQGKLQTHSPARTKELHGMIQDSFITDLKEPVTMSFGPPGRQTSVWVTASTAIHSGLHSDEDFAAIFVHSARIQRQIPLAAFSSKYQLSPAEDRLAKALLNGCHTLNEAADHLRVSKHTVRTQIKSIFSKTKTNSQTELIKKILTSPSALIYDHATSTSLISLKDDSNDQKRAVLSMHLHDGRRLEWKEFGVPNGIPVMVFHSLTGAHPDYTTAKAMGIRLIVPERPGAHGSDPLPGRTYLDWSEDVRQLADYLEFEHFSLVGFSAGTPYVLACIERMPERIRSISLIACMAPILSEDDFTGMLPFNYTSMRLAYHSPELLAKFMNIFLNDLEKDASSYFDSVAEYQPVSDLAVLNKQETMAHFLQAFQAAAKENFQQLCDEIILCASNWPLDLSRYRGFASIWHGLEDPLVPPQMGQRIAAQLDYPNTHYIEGKGNYLAYELWDDILSELIQNH